MMMGMAAVVVVLVVVLVVLLVVVLVVVVVVVVVDVVVVLVVVLVVVDTFVLVVDTVVVNVVVVIILILPSTTFSICVSCNAFGGCTTVPVLNPTLVSTRRTIFGATVTNGSTSSAIVLNLALSFVVDADDTCTILAFSALSNVILVSRMATKRPEAATSWIDTRRLDFLNVTST